MKRFAAAAGIAGALALVGAPVFAQSPCAALCAVTCVKPITLPDRWDDVTPIAGYAGGTVNGRKMPNWRNNASWDSESVEIDLNGNGLYDPGDSYWDANGNGSYDCELYDPAVTGYRPAVDLGLELTLKLDNDAKPTPGQYQAIALPPVNRGTPILNDAGDYAENWASCNPVLAGSGDACVLQPGNFLGATNLAMRDLIALDPDASWDPVTGGVQGSRFAQSPRVILVPVHDPRIPISYGNTTVVLTKVVALFMEQMEGDAMVRVRFLRAIGSGEPCAGGGDGFVVECPTPARSTSWGRVKNLYR